MLICVCACVRVGLGEHRLRAILRTVYEHNLDATIAFKSRQCGGVVGTYFFRSQGDSME